MRTLILAIVILFSSIAVAEDSLRYQRSSVFELRASYPTLIDMQYGHKWWSWLSTDAIVAVRGAFGFGLTLQPIPFLFAQAYVGKPYFNLEVQAEDAPSFEPGIIYGVRAGFRFTFRNQRNFLTISSGMLSLIDNAYCYNCGFRLPGDFSPLMYRTERRYYWTGALGLGWEL
jgi:hypothetical protein